MIGFEPTFATPLQITVSKTELVTSVLVPTVRIELTCDQLPFLRLMRARGYVGLCGQSRNRTHIELAFAD